MFYMHKFTLGYEELYAIDYHPPPPLQRKIMKEKLMANLIGAKFRACKWAKMTGDTVCENDLIVTIEIEGVAKSIEVRSKYAGILLYCESRIVSGGKVSIFQ